jgi:predicted Zn-dependent protease
MSGIGVDELEDAARRAMDAATSAGASDAEAWSEGSRSREVRVHDGEVESLTEASGRGVGIRAWIGTRTGYAYGTDLSESALGELAEAAVGAPRRAPAAPTRARLRPTPPVSRPRSRDCETRA